MEHEHSENTTPVDASGAENRLELADLAVRIPIDKLKPTPTSRAPTSTS